LVSREFLEAAAESVVKCDKDQAVDLAHQALDKGMDPLEVITDGFTVGIVRVGEMFDRGELFLPELVLCSEVMKAATDILNAAVVKEEQVKGAKVVIGTVEGDIHDIGKGIVVTLMKAHGFEVYDLGRDVPIMRFIEEAERVGADVIGSSALLTTTMEGQKKLEEALRQEGLREKYKTIVGGAPVTERWRKRIGADAYAENATDAVTKVLQLLEG